jgi:hypothetical protein
MYVNLGRYLAFFAGSLFLIAPSLGFADGLFPVGATSSTAVRQGAGDSTLVSTSSVYFTVLYFSLGVGTAPTSQLLQCRTDNTVYTLLTSAVLNNGQQDSFFYKTFPPNTTCYLRTFDNHLTYATLTYVPYALPSYSTTTSPVSTSENVNYHDWIYVNAVIIFLLAIGVMSTLWSIFKVQ